MKNWWQPHHACDKHDIIPAPGIHGQSRKIKAPGFVFKYREDGFGDSGSDHH